jgi:oxygen-independent coproporphyrinogen-3 oxidase
MAGVYLSYPFCGQKCTYCNFASGVLPRELEGRYLAALKSELKAAEWPWIPETVYLGGGTPSRIDPAEFRAILDPIPGRPWTEATIEAAPGGISLELAGAWHRAGINRVSLGVQSFVQRELSRTGRKHSAEIVAAEVEALRSAGLHNFNIDLIAGLPGQTRESWTTSLEWIEMVQAPHVSVYMLEVDEDSRLGAEVLAFGKRYGAPEIPSDEEIAEYYETAVDRLAALGIRRYEISNFARPGFESKHNLKYWRREPYFGFGADAHSFDGVMRWQNVESAAEYVERMEQQRSPIAERTAADPAEAFFLGLRLEQGIEEDWSQFKDGIERFEQDGLLEVQGRRLRLTPRGVLLSNEVFAHFV